MWGALVAGWSLATGSLPGRGVAVPRTAGRADGSSLLVALGCCATCAASGAGACGTGRTRGPGHQRRRPQRPPRRGSSTDFAPEAASARRRTRWWGPGRWSGSGRRYLRGRPASRTRSGASAPGCTVTRSSPHRDFVTTNGKRVPRSGWNGRVIRICGASTAPGAFCSFEERQGGEPHQDPQGRGGLWRTTTRSRTSAPTCPGSSRWSTTPTDCTLRQDI